MKEFRGESVQKHNRILTQGILRNTEVKVRQEGVGFWNSSSFGVLFFLLTFCEKGWDRTRYGFNVLCQESLKKMPAEDTISIAATPDKVDRDYLRMLDGGILHEAFHTFYTEGKYVQKDRLYSILSKHYRRDVPYGEMQGLFKSLWNIFEDSMIERRGMVDFAGAKRALQSVHEDVWKREAIGRNLKVGSVAQDDRGRIVPAFQMIDHLTCYLRDQVENYLDNAPLDEYEPSVRLLVDTEFADLLQRGRQSSDSYDAFELAMETLHRIFDLNCDGGGEDGEDEEDSSGNEADSSEEEADEESAEGEAAAGPSNEEGDDEEGDDESEGKDGNEEEDSEGTEDTDTGEESDDSKNEDASAPKGSQGEVSDKGPEDSPEEVSEEDPKEIPDSVRDELANAKDAPNMKDHADVINELAIDQFGTVPNYPLPYSREYDKITYLQVRDKDFGPFKALSKSVRKDTLYIRSKLVAFLSGKSKTRRHHRQEKGRRLSGRSIHEVIYKEKPRPFQTKSIQTKAKAAVSIVIDESHSMRTNRPEKILTTLAVSLQQLRIPFEVIGFQYGYALRFPHVTITLEELEKAGFTRTDPVRFNIFRTFDEPLTERALSKLMQVRSEGSTPLEDGLDFAARRLIERPEERKVLLVITDGQPTSTRGRVTMQQSERCRLANNEAKMLEGMGVETLFVGYLHDGVQVFDNHVIINQHSEFGTKMNEYLLKSLREKRF